LSKLCKEWWKYTQDNTQQTTYAGRRLSTCTVRPLALYQHCAWIFSPVSRCWTAVKTTVGGIALLNSVLQRTAFHRASAGTALMMLMLFRGVLWQAGICDPPVPAKCAGLCRRRGSGAGLNHCAAALRYNHGQWELLSTITMVSGGSALQPLHVTNQLSFKHNTNSMGKSWFCDG